MTNLLQQRTLKEIVKQYSSLYGLPEHKAFLFLVIEKYLANLELNSIDIEEAIVDGSDDCGIDAVYIDDESHARPKVYFFQSKFYQSEDAFEKQFEGSALEKIQGAINDFVLKGKINKSYQNSRLVDKLHSVKNLVNRNPEIIIVLCANSKDPSPTAKARLEEFINEANESAAGKYLSVEYLNLDRIAKEFIAPQQKKQIDLKIQTSGKYLTEDTGDVRLFVGGVEAQDLAQLVEKYGNDLFEKNVRGYLGSKPINKSIYTSATSDSSPYFVYMNNGITITCSRFSHTPIQNSPLLEITNGQIVNGQQTIRSLHQAYKTKELKPDVKVLVRLVETTDAELLAKIIEATNTQTRVTSRDLRSNDEMQKLIEQHLLSRGYFYEARKNKYKGKDATKRVDAEVAAQAYYSVFFESPGPAKNKKKLLFGDQTTYESIFNDSLEPENILYSFKLIKGIQKLNMEDKYKKYTFLNDATLHTAALMHKFKGKIDLGDNEKIIKTYEKVVDSINKVILEKRMEEGDKYEHRRTFIDPETYGRVVEVLMK